MIALQLFLTAFWVLTSAKLTQALYEAQVDSESPLTKGQVIFVKACVGLVFAAWSLGTIFTIWY